jgi:hypothetical protein
MQVFLPRLEDASTANLPFLLRFVVDLIKLYIGTTLSLLEPIAPKRPYSSWYLSLEELEKGWYMGSIGSSCMHCPGFHLGSLGFPGCNEAGPDLRLRAFAKVEALENEEVTVLRSHPRWVLYHLLPAC